MLRRCCLEFAQLALAALVLGWFLGYPLAAFALASAGYAAWLAYRLEAIKSLIDSHGSNSDDSSAPVAQTNLLQRLRRRWRGQSAEQYRLQRLLAQSRRALEVIPDPIVLLDESHELIWFNASAAQLFRIQLSRNRRLSFLSLIRDTEVEKALERLGSRHRHQHTTARLPARPHIVFDVHLHRLSNATRLVHLRDISEIEGLVQAQRHLLANFSHEIKTPLTLIQGYVDIVEEKINAEHERFGRIRELVGRISQFSEENIARMRAMLKHDSPDIPLVPVCIARWCQNYIDDCRSAGQLRHPVEIEADPGLIVNGRAQELDSIFSNLLNNARNHTPPGTRIVVRAFRQYDTAIFEVEDEGPGIPEHQIDHLTEMFYQSGERIDHQRNKAAAATHGMGLPIVESLLRRCRGTLSIRSAPGKGSVFRCKIPLEDSHSQT